MNALQLIQAAKGEMGLAVPTFVAGNTAADEVQLLALLNMVGGELQRDFPWQKLETEYRFQTVYYVRTGYGTDGTNQITLQGSPLNSVDPTYMVSGPGVVQDTYITNNPPMGMAWISNPLSITIPHSSPGTFLFCKTKYSMPADFDRIIDRTNWDKTKHWRMIGPETPQQWQWLKSGFISTGPRIRFRIMGGYFQIWPMPTTVETLGFEYLSNGWAFDASGNRKTTVTVDTDTTIFNDRLMIDGIKSRYFQVKGFDSAAYDRSYNIQRDIAKANDAGSQTLSFAPTPSAVLLGYEQIPDSGYGS